VTFAVAASACGGETATTSGGGTTTTNGNATTVTYEPSLLGISDAIQRVGEVCELRFGMAGCPPDVMCNPPPPRVVVCPATLTQNGAIVRHADGSCLLVLDLVCVTGPLPTCNPPPPRVVPCDDGGSSSGLRERRPNGECVEHVAPTCPPPEQTCTRQDPRVVACPPPEAH
jgi:hypothetical protein